MWSKEILQLGIPANYQSSGESDFDSVLDDYSPRIFALTKLIAVRNSAAFLKFIRDIVVIENVVRKLFIMEFSVSVSK